MELKNVPIVSDFPASPRRKSLAELLSLLTENHQNWKKICRWLGARVLSSVESNVPRPPGGDLNQVTPESEDIELYHSIQVASIRARAVNETSRARDAAGRQLTRSTISPAATGPHVDNSDTHPSEQHRVNANRTARRGWLDRFRRMARALARGQLLVGTHPAVTESELPALSRSNSSPSSGDSPALSRSS